MRKFSENTPRHHIYMYGNGKLSRFKSYFSPGCRFLAKINNIHKLAVVKMKLEEKISRGNTAFIHSMDFNSKEKQLTLKLVKNPRFLKRPDQRIIFSNVSRFQIDGESKHSVDQIRGINEYTKDHMVKYVFLTEQRTFMFWTDKEPSFSDLP